MSLPTPKAPSETASDLERQANAPSPLAHLAEREPECVTCIVNYPHGCHRHKPSDPS